MFAFPPTPNGIPWGPAVGSADLTAAHLDRLPCLTGPGNMYQYCYRFCVHMGSLTFAFPITPSCLMYYYQSPLSLLDMPWLIGTYAGHEICAARMTAYGVESFMD